MPTSPSPQAKENEARELLRVLARQMPLVLCANIMVAPGCVGVMLFLGEGEDLRLWLTGMLALTALRWWQLARFHAAPLALPAQIRAWRMVFTLGSGVSGCLYGLLGFIATDYARPLSSLFALMVLVGMTAGSIASLAAATWAYAAFAIPTMTPIIFRHWQIGGATGLTIAGFGVIYLLVNLGYAQIQRRSLLEAIKLRFDKEELIQELEAARQKSDAANDAKTRFLLSAGHDLRQPLYAITLLIEAIGRHLPPQAERQAAAIRACAHTIDDLLDRMLEAARLDAGKTEAKMEDAPLQSLFERLLVEFEPEAEKREVVLKCVDSSLVIETDIHLVTCILRNFLSNALRYGAGGKVLMGARRVGDAVRIEVLDQGPGIPPEHMEAIFEPFYQVGNAERAPENGHGLGLAIAKGMATMMGARIGTRSQLHRGSAFTITLKAGAGTQAADPPQLFAPADALMGMPLVLLVEDEAIVRETTCELLTAWGCRVIAAADGAQALAAAAQSRDPLDCVITDLRLPGSLDGFAVVKALREKATIPLPAILTTADPAVGRGHAEGVTVLTKPVAPSRLRRTIAAVLDKDPMAGQC
jgi:hypothetical protein